MKKPLFVIAEIFLSAVFVAAAAATAAVAVDIKTDMCFGPYVPLYRASR